MELCHIIVFVLAATAMTNARGRTGSSEEGSCNVLRAKDGEIKPCQFPFRWGDRIFYGCTTYTDPEDKAWCSTATNGSHFHVQGDSQYGHCLEDTCDLEDGTWDRVDNINALKTQRLLDKFEKDEVGLKSCYCANARYIPGQVEEDVCPWSNKLLRQTKQMGNHPIRRKLAAFYEERVCEDGKVHCCSIEPPVTTPAPVTTTTQAPPVGRDHIPKPAGLKWDYDFSADQDSGKWLPQEGSCGVKTVQTSIVGGEECKMGDCPFTVLIGYKNSQGGTGYYCGGSLINRWYVLTAAHCVPPSQGIPEIVEIALGEHDVGSNPDCNLSECVAEKQSKKPAKIIPHPDYDGRPNSPDIALIRLDSPVDLWAGNSSVSTALPVCLPWKESDFVYKSLPGDEFTVMGWGYTGDGPRFTDNNVAQDRLLQVNVPLFDSEKCKKFWRTLNADTQFCAGGKEGEDSCDGDSGGPLSVRQYPDTPYYQVGLVSYGTGTCAIGYAAVYTSVSHFLPWIYSHLEA